MMSRDGENEITKEYPRCKTCDNYQVPNKGGNCCAILYRNTVHHEAFYVEPDFGCIRHSDVMPRITVMINDRVYRGDSIMIQNHYVMIDDEKVGDEISGAVEIKVTGLMW